MILERPMVEFLIKLVLVARSKLKSSARLEAENIVLREQVIAVSRIPHTFVDHFHRSPLHAPGAKPSSSKSSKRAREPRGPWLQSNVLAGFGSS